MTALLLNSGMGSRMGALTQDCPKCMCDIGAGHTIISWQLELLRQHDVRKVVITTGPFEKKLKEHVKAHGHGLQITFVNNPVYQTTNYIYSMLLAKEYLQDDILLLHGDLVLEHSVLQNLLDAPASSVAVDSSLPLPEKDFKACIRRGKVSAIGTTFFGNDCYACQPAYKWLSSDFQLWMAAIETHCKNGDVKIYAENAFNEMQEKPVLLSIELNGRLCNEIDNPEDREMVAKRFLFCNKEYKR